MRLQATAIRDMLYAVATYSEAYDTLREMAGFTQGAGSRMYFRYHPIPFPYFVKENKHRGIL